MNVTSDNAHGAIVSLDSRELATLAELLGQVADHPDSCECADFNDCQCGDAFSMVALSLASHLRDGLVDLQRAVARTAR